MTYEPLVKIVGDGNCLFRCFAHFLYSDQTNHYKIRMVIVNFVVENWDYYENSIIGNPDYPSVVNSISYYDYMSQSTIFGSAIEIEAFVRIYDVSVSIIIEGTTIIHKHGNDNSPFKLVLQLSRPSNIGHYDVIECNNQNISIVKNQVKNKKQNLKRKYSKPVDAVDVKKKKIDNYNVMKNVEIEKCKINIVVKPNKHVVKQSDLKKESFFGDMTYKCKFCSALYWRAETRKNRCCNKGRICLPPLSKYNETLRKLLFDNSFRLLIRYYNNLFSFATFSANVQNEKKKAIYNLKIQGQISHITPTNILNNYNNKPICGQLYIYDDDTATKKRLESCSNVNEQHLNM